jgi:rubrerythrin
MLRIHTPKEPTVPEKPSYLGLLNAISLGEGRAHRYLSAWAEKTNDPEVRQAIRTVAIREGEHALAFEKRLCELGFEVQDRPDPNFEKTLDLLSSFKSDLEKFEALGYGRQSQDGEDPFTRMFEDTSLDIQTGELLGRYIAEERDSGRILRGCYQKLRDRAGNGGADTAGIGAELRQLQSRIEESTELLEDLQHEIKKLRKKS